jgi:hypothetical protein
VYWLLAAFKGNIFKKKSYIGKFYNMTPLTTKIVDFIVEYLLEYEAIRKKALTRVSGAQMEFFDEKPKDRKTLVTGPIKFFSLKCFS